MAISTLPFGMVFVRFYDYRAFKPDFSLLAFEAHFENGDLFDRLRTALWEHYKGSVGNHSGWELKNGHGQHFVYYFADWTFRIYAL